MEEEPTMSSAELQKMFTIQEWGAWKRYATAKGIQPSKVKSSSKTDNWPEYEVNEFIKVKNIFLDADKEKMSAYLTSEGGSDSKGSEPVATGSLSASIGCGEQLELFPHDHIPGRREAQTEQLPLQESGDGHKDIGFTAKPVEGVQGFNKGPVGS